MWRLLSDFTKFDVIIHELFSVVEMQKLRICVSKSFIRAACPLAAAEHALR